MSKPLPGQNTFTGLAPPWSLTSLDANFTNVWAAIDDIGTYSNTLTDTGAVNALVVTPASSITFSLVSGISFDVLVANTTTSTTVTLNANGTGAKTVLLNDGAAPPVGSLIAGGIYRVLYNGTAYLLPTPSALDQLTVGPPASGATTTVNILNNIVGATWSDGTGTLAISTDTLHNLYVGTTSATSLNLIVDNSTKVSISTAGDITARGVALCKYKAGSTSRSSTTTFSNDPDLQVAIPSAGTYRFEIFCQLTWNSGGFQGNVNYSGSYTSASSFFTCFGQGNGTSGSPAGANYVSSSPTSAFSWGVSQAGAQIGSLAIVGSIVATAAGTIALSWTQSSSNANASTIVAGSYITVTKLS